MNESELIAHMQKNGKKSIVLLQKHLKINYLQAKKICDSFELPIIKLPVVNFENLFAIWLEKQKIN